MSTLDIAIVIVAFNEIQKSFSVTEAQLSWMITSYTIMSAAVQVPSGRMADRWGAHRTFLLGSSLFAIGSLLCGLAPSIAILIVARVLQGVGSAVQTPSALSLIVQSLPANMRSVGVGLWGATSGMGAALSPSLGALIVDRAGWRWVFLLNVPIGAVIVGIGSKILRRFPPQPHVSADWLGSVAIMMGVGALTLGLVQGDDWGWSSPATVGSFALGVAALGGLVARAARRANTILDLGLFRIPSFFWASAVAVSLPIGYFVEFFGSVQFLTKVWGYSELQAGLLLTPVSVLQAATTLAAGRVADKFGHRRIMLPGGLLFTLGGITWLFVLGTERNLPGFFVGSALLGLGIGMTYATFNSAAVHKVENVRVGTASGLNNTINRVSASLGIAVAVALAGGAVEARIYDRLWIVVLIAGVLTALFASRIDTRRSPP